MSVEEDSEDPEAQLPKDCWPQLSMIQKLQLLQRPPVLWPGLNGAWPDLKSIEGHRLAKHRPRSQCVCSAPPPAERVSLSLESISIVAASISNFGGAFGVLSRSARSSPIVCLSTSCLASRTASSKVSTELLAVERRSSAILSSFFFRTGLCSGLLCSAMPCSNLLCAAPLRAALLRSARLCSSFFALLFFDKLCDALRCYATLGDARRC